MLCLERDYSDVLELEAIGKTQDALNLIGEKKLPPEVLTQIAGEFYKSNSVIALVIAREILKKGLNHWLLHVINYHLSGLDLMPSQEEAAKSLNWLSRYFKKISSEKRKEYSDLLRPRLAQEVYNGYLQNKIPLINHLLELSKVLMPNELAAFNNTRSTTSWNLTEIKETSNRRSPISFSGLKMNPSKLPRKAIIASRKYYYFHDGSRLSDIGPRILSCLKNNGWEAELYLTGPPDINHVVEKNYSDIHNLCIQMCPDLLILEEIYVGENRNPTPLEFIRKLRADFPHIRILSTYLDGWQTALWPEMRGAVGFLDGIWCPLPSLSLFQETIFSNKVLFFPLPNFSPHKWDDSFACNQIAFCGGLAEVNWHRGLWIAALLKAGVHLHVDISKHKPDGLSPEASFRMYIKKIQSFIPNINFASRYDGSKIHTGRSFEVPLAGALLIQESNPEIEHYFTPGEHFLPFTHLDDLIEITDFLRQNPKDVETILRKFTDH